MSKRKLLLADDSITIQKVVNLTFADEGIEVIAVGDGDSAMRKFEEFMPDLVMADVNMPGLSGYEICQIVKQNEITRHIPVILLVGSFEPFSEEQAKEVGADDFLTKPFQSIRQLVNKVTDLLNRSRDLPLSKSSVSDSLSDTLELEKPEEIPTDYGDAGMDDEMIETSPANEFTADSYQQNETTIDYAKTQPLNADDLKGFRALAETDSAPPESQDTVEENVAQPEAAETSEPQIDYYSPEAIRDEVAPVSNDAPDDSSEPAGFAETEEETSPEPEAAFYEETAESTETEDAAGQFEIVRESEDEISEDVSGENDEVLQVAESDSEPAVEDDTLEIPAVSEEPEAERSSWQAEIPDLETPEAETESFPDSPEAPELTESPESTDEGDELAVDGPDGYKEPATEEISDAAPDEPIGEDVPETMEEDAESPETAVEEEPEPVQLVDETPVTSSVNIPSIGFDDGDLLDLPPLVEETGIRPSAKMVEEVAVAEPAVEPEPVVEGETVAETADNAKTDVLQSFPPELIEAIARKVAEQISAKTMSDVLPQITELVMKKMAEEKKE